MKSKIKLALTAFFIILIAVILLLYPKIISKGIIDGLLMCGNILIPAIFPFCVLAVFIFKCGILNNIKGKYGKIFAVFLISLIGGYPVGAKIISNEYSNGFIESKNAKIMLCFCINAGPAFIYSFAGIGVLQNKLAGIILLVSHMLSSLQILIFLLLSKKIKPSVKPSKSYLKGGLETVFVESVSTASNSLISICSFTVIFSGLIELTKHFNVNGALVSILEVINGIVNTNNIYLISFLLGFSGFCVIIQIYSCCNEFCDIIFLIFTRLIHGLLSVFNVTILTKLLHYKLSVFSNAKAYDYKVIGETTELSFMLIITALVFLVSLSYKKYSGKVLKDAFLL